MELTDKHWKAFGFRKDTSLGTEYRWYYIRTEFRGMDNVPSPGAISLGGVLSFSCNDFKNPKTVQKLSEYMNKLYKDYGYEQGRTNLRHEFKALFNIMS